VLKTIRIENFKSIEKLALPLGRVNVFIGENGSGKSNILEAIAIAGAAAAHKLDNEFLASRGIRVSGPELMRSAFKVSSVNEPIKISIEIDNGSELIFDLQNDNQPYSTWKNPSLRTTGDIEGFKIWFVSYLSSLKNVNERKKLIEDLTMQFENISSNADDVGLENIIKLNIDIPQDVLLPKMKTDNIEDFIIYSPENSALRLFESEGQIEPLGINGQGLFKLLGVMSKGKNKRDLKGIKDIKESLQLFSWFEDFKVKKDKSYEGIDIVDRFIEGIKPSFDQRSVNEGFLFIVFYFALFTSKLTPRFFAIDNIDSSLNPKLCEELMRRLAALAKMHEKQVILTTHNPAILDGLDLGDPDHRLFIVSRGPRGQTRVRRFEMKPSNEKPRRLSALFLSGALGGLPKGF
jgi:predicted ATPase